MNQIKYAHTLNTQLHAYHGDIALTHVGENKPWDMHELWISNVGLGSILFYIYIYIYTHTHTHTIYKRIPLFELNFYVVQTYPH